MWQLHKDVCPVVVPINYIDNSSVVHNHNIRQANQFHIKYSRTALASTSFMFSSPRYWNSLPVNLRECNELRQFSNKLKIHLLESY